MGTLFSKRSNLIIDPSSLNIETVEKLLLRRDFNINTLFYITTSYGKKRTTFLHAAIENYQDELIDWLLAQKPKLNIRIERFGRPLNVAVQSCDLDTVCKLVSLGINLNFRNSQTGATPLFYSCWFNYSEITEYLVENGANVNINTHKNGVFRGYSPLQIYAQKGDIKITKLMVSKGANVNHKSLKGLTPLICAVRRGHRDVVKLLIDNGANINNVYKENGDSLFLIHCAVFRNSIETLEYLCNLDEFVTDVNTLTKKKKNTLWQHIITRDYNPQETIDFLLDVGLDINLETEFGERPIELTSRYLRFPFFYPVINKYVLKLISANLPVCQRDKDAVGEEFTDFAAECCQEVAKIKNTKIGSLDITLYDILHINEQDLALKLKHHQSEFSDMIGRKEMTSRFPIYGGMLASKLGKVYRRIPRLEKAEEVMMEIFNRLKLPYTLLWELFYYLNNCDLKKITGLIAKKVDLNIRVPNIGLPINVAISKHDLATVRKLVSSGARLDFCDPTSGDSVLFHASLYANIQIAEYLIKNGADVNIELTKHGHFNGYSPLQFYAERGNVQITESLLSKGANVNHNSADGSTPLVSAVQSGNLKVIKLLIEHGADINCTYQKFNDVVSILHAALLSRKVEVIEFFCNLDEMTTDVNVLTIKSKKSVQHHKLNDVFYSNEIVSFLPDAGFDVNMEDRNGKLAIDYIACGRNFEANHLVMKKHLLKLIAANLPVHERNKDAIGKNLENFAAKCHQEVIKMKDLKIGDVNINFYEVLLMSIHKLAVKLKCHLFDFSEITNRKKMREVFPLYGGMLFFKLGSVQRRISWLDKAEEIMMTIFNRLGLPYDILRELL
ncbi:uncharacterized protein LOC141532851 [Cotesia typhae]|uniref:uncharacterized protein LOC141532851 n=1 Tax=Cotesia typhae TaxID=2053667 RepID=UPI003D69B52F